MNTYLKLAANIGAGIAAALVALWAGFTAYNFVEIMQRFGGIYNNLSNFVKYPGDTLEIVQMSFYNSLGDAGFSYHDLGMTGPFVLLYAIVVSGLYLRRLGK